MEIDFCFFCAQLPEFPVGAVPPLALTEFDARLTNVPADAADYVRACDFPCPAAWRVPKDSAAGQFRAFENSLRYDIACFRAVKHGLPIPPRPRNVHPVDGLAAQIEALAKADPLERERKLNRLRSDFLEKIAAANPFSREAAACYRIRLALGWREAAFRDPSGRAIFRDAVDAIERESVGDANTPA